eukprot:403371017
MFKQLIDIISESKLKDIEIIKNCFKIEGKDKHDEILCQILKKYLVKHLQEVILDYKTNNVKDLNQWLYIQTQLKSLDIPVIFEVLEIQEKIQFVNDNIATAFQIQLKNESDFFNTHVNQQFDEYNKSIEDMLIIEYEDIEDIATQEKVFDNIRSQVDLKTSKLQENINSNKNLLASSSINKFVSPIKQINQKQESNNRYPEIQTSDQSKYKQSPLQASFNNNLLQFSQNQKLNENYHNLQNQESSSNVNFEKQQSYKKNKVLPVAPSTMQNSLTNYTNFQSQAFQKGLSSNLNQQSLSIGGNLIAQEKPKGIMKPELRQEGNNKQVTKLISQNKPLTLTFDQLFPLLKGQYFPKSSEFTLSKKFFDFFKLILNKYFKDVILQQLPQNFQLAQIFMNQLKSMVQNYANKAADLIQNTFSLNQFLQSQQFNLLLSKLMYFRLKATDYMKQIKMKLSSQTQIQNSKTQLLFALEKIETEIHLKLISTLNQILETYSLLTLESFELNILSSFMTQKWNSHRENTTSMSWLYQNPKKITDEQGNIKIQKSVILLPSPGIFGLIRQFYQMLRPFYQKTNQAVALEVLKQNLQFSVIENIQNAIMKYICIEPSRDQSQISDYLDDLSSHPFPSQNDDQGVISENIMKIITFNQTSTHPSQDQPIVQSKELDFQCLNLITQNIETTMKALYKFIKQSLQEGQIAQIDLVSVFLKSDNINSQNQIQSQPRQGRQGKQSSSKVRKEEDGIEEIMMGEQTSRESFQLQEFLQITRQKDINESLKLFDSNKSLCNQLIESIDKNEREFIDYLQQNSSFAKQVREFVQDLKGEQNNVIKQIGQEKKSSYKIFPVLVSEEGFGPETLLQNEKLQNFMVENILNPKQKHKRTEILYPQSKIAVILRRFDLCNCPENFPVLNDIQTKYRDQILDKVKQFKQEQ